MKRKQIKRALAIICAIIMMLSTGLSLVGGVYVYADEDGSDDTQDCTEFFEKLVTITTDDGSTVTIESLLAETLSYSGTFGGYSLEEYYDEEGFAKFIAQAMSYETILEDLDFIDECNELRANDSNFESLEDLKVSPTLMLASAVSAYYAAQYVGHTAVYALTAVVNGENLAWGYTDPFDGWYYDEKDIYDNGGSGTTGHYTNICSSSYTTTGFCYVASDGSTSDGYWELSYKTVAEQCFSSKTAYSGESYTTDEIRSLLEEYIGAHDYEKVEATDATCTEDGNIEYYECILCGSYFTYNEDTDTYTKVSADDVVIAASHTESEAVQENVVEATCTGNGSYDSVVYCSVCGEELSRETVTTEATGHTASEAVTENSVEATCTEYGNYDSVVYCSVCGAELSRETVVVDATGHNYDYESGEWIWADDYSTATFTVTCKNDSSHTESYEATVTSEVTDATCTTAGTTVYMATVIIDGTGYTDSKTVEGEALGHSYSATITFNDDYTATVTVTCANDDSHSYTAEATVTSSKTSATCTEAGKIVYTASYSDDNVTAEDVTVTVTTDEATGHDYDYDNGVWTWTATDDGYTATYTVTCNNDSDHTVSYEATVTSTEQEDGSTIYAAAVYVSDSDETYTDTYTVAVEDEEDGEDGEDSDDDDSVQTSDNGNIAMMGVILLMAIAGCAGVAVSKRR